MTNFSIDFTSLSELDLLWNEYNPIDSQTTLIQIFCANATLDSVTKIHDYFTKKFKKSIILGTTTDGIIKDSNVYNNTKNVVTITHFEKTKLKSTIIENEDCYGNSFLVGKSIINSLYKEDIKVLLTFSDGINTNGENYLEGINSVNKDLVVSGGMAADNGNIVETFVFNRDKITSSGAVAVALYSCDLDVYTDYSFDWMPIGKRLKVTKSIENRVYEIENIPVVDLYAKYMGKDLANALPQIGIEFPLIFEKDGMSVGRAPLKRHNDGSLTFAGNIKEGEFVRFGVGNIELILRNSDYHLRSNFTHLKHNIDAVFVYSCMARRRFMDNYIKDELDVLNLVGNLSGFFTYGEFFHSNNSNKLLNQTMTYLLLSENNDELHIDINKNFNEKSYAIKAEHVIAHLANAVSNELAELNDSLEQKVKESYKHIYQQAYFDKLTGLANRLSLITTLSESVGKVLFLINVDDFSVINDFYGYKIGDEVLIKLSDIFQKYISDKKAKVFKLPSDEFAILMEMEHTKDVIEKEIKSLLYVVNNEEFLIDGHYTHVSITISAAFVNDHGSGLINADMALKSAKQSAKEFMIFDDDLQLSQQNEKNIKIVTTIKKAILSDNIIPYFQPILDTKTLEIVKYESLVRLIEYDGRVLSPFFFLEVAQKIKLYPQITEIMIEKCFNYFSKNGLSFSINLSISDILNYKTRSMLFEKIVFYNIAEQLTIEILETQEIDNEESVKKFINSIYAIGAKIAIDDFGSGFANFEHMTSIRSDYMKIDGSLIKNIDHDKNSRLVVETIVVFAKKLGKKTVAEFVHSKEVFEIVKEMGVDYVQGYYFGEPKPEVLDKRFIEN